MVVWKRVSIQDVVSILGDGLHGTPIFSANGEYAFVNGNNLVNGKLVIKSDTKKVDRSQYEKYRKPLGNRTILVSINGTLGNIGVYNGEKVILGKSACYFNIREEYSFSFLRYVVSSPDFKNYLESNATGTTIKNVSLKQMREYTFDIPESIDVQERIADILSSIDKKIETNNAINRNLSEQVFAIFDRMYSTHDITDTCNLSELVQINPKRALPKNKEARCVDMAKLSTSGAFPDGWEYKPYTGGMKFINGDTLLARITPCLENGKTAYVNFLNEDEVAFGSTEYVVLAPKGKTPSELLYCLARYPQFIDYAVKNMNGSSGRQRVSAETIGQYQIPNFSDDELESFGNAVRVFFETMKENSFENMRLTELRDSLLPKLMSGELDVSDIEL